MRGLRTEVRLDLVAPNNSALTELNARPNGSSLPTNSWTHVVFTHR